MKNQNKKHKYAQVKEGWQGIKINPHCSTPEEIISAFDYFWKSMADPVVVLPGQMTAGTDIDAGHNGWNNSGALYETELSFKQVEALRDLVMDLKRNFKDYGERRYNEGLKDGRNCLIQLNNGTLSIDDFYKDLGGKNKHNI